MSLPCYPLVFSPIPFFPPLPHLTLIALWIMASVWNLKQLGQREGEQENFWQSSSTNLGSNMGVYGLIWFYTDNMVEYGLNIV